MSVRSRFSTSTSGMRFCTDTFCGILISASLVSWGYLLWYHFSPMELNILFIPAVMGMFLGLLFSTHP